MMRKGVVEKELNVFIRYVYVCIAHALNFLCYNHNNCMEATCSFKKLTGGICSSNTRYERKVALPLASCERDISRHNHSVGICDVQSEISLF